MIEIIESVVKRALKHSGKSPNLQSNELKTN